MVNRLQIVKAIRATGAKVKVVDGEYIVNIPGGNEATAYYTDDGHDALATAKHMMGHHKKRKAGLFGY